MPRRARPWYRKQTGWWMVYVDGQPVKLTEGPKDEDHRLLAEELLLQLRQQSLRPLGTANLRVADLVEGFLHHSHTNLAPDTYRIHRYYGQCFVDACGDIIAVDLRPFHVSEWLDRMRSPDRVVKDKKLKAELRKQHPDQVARLGVDPRAWSDTTVYNARRFVIRVFSWAKEQGILTTNQFAGLRQVKPPPRNRALYEMEFQALHGKARGRFRDFLLVLWETGARPKELRDLCWEQVQDDRFVLKVHKTAKKTGKDRVIYLSQAVKSVLARLATKTTGPVFLNHKGLPWTRNAVRQQMKHLRTTTGLPSDVCAYLCRHGFGTKAILSGVNPAVVAELMGHTSMEMVSKVYVHLAGEHAHLQEAIDKISGSAKPAASAPDSAPKTASVASPGRNG